MDTLFNDFKQIKNAARKIHQITVDQINAVLLGVADAAVQYMDSLLIENQKDLDRMDPNDPKFDRLKLTPERIKGIAEDIRNVSRLQYPIGKVLEEKTLPNGLLIKKVTVPLGVVGIIYEARPNVTFDVFSLCLKSGNVCVLKGGSDAEFSNKAIVALIHQVLESYNLDQDLVYLMPTDRASTEKMLSAVEYIDIIIPRGSQHLIDFVRQHSKVPVIETGAGIVHTYLDKSADLEKAISIIDNAKTRRVSVCNALDCLIIHKDRLGDLIEISKPLAKKQVHIFADEFSYTILKDNYPPEYLSMAQPEHFGTEFLSLKMSVKTVSGLQQAFDHINKYSSKHSEAIIAEDETVVDQFLKAVDAAAVYANTSTAFTDGAQFGLGAEIGISTQKLHARGPMALNELTSYKWIIKGQGQIRPV